MSRAAGAADSSGGRVATIDGRTARAARTRTAVVDALLALIREGDLRPTGARIAVRAGVSLRSVFQHFADMEALLAEAARRENERLDALTRPLSSAGTVEERVDALVTQRSVVFEAAASVRRAAMLQEPFSPALRANRDAVYARAGAVVRELFGAELAACPSPARRSLAAALDAAASWDAWEHLRARQALSVLAAKRAMRLMLLSLLAGVGRGDAPIARIAPSEQRRP
jgi:AcrR family transcriptional regulator